MKVLTPTEMLALRLEYERLSPGNIDVVSYDAQKNLAIIGRKMPEVQDVKSGAPCILVLAHVTGENALDEAKLLCSVFNAFPQMGATIDALATEISKRAPPPTSMSRGNGGKKKRELRAV